MYTVSAGSIENCYNSGTLSDGDDEYNNSRAAGIAMSIGGFSSLINCYNIGGVDETIEREKVALMAGYYGLAVTIKNCYYLDRAGYNGVMNSNEDIIGKFERKTEAQMKLKSTYEQWKFGSNTDNPWKMLEYPVLYWQQ